MICETAVDFDVKGNPDKNFSVLVEYFGYRQPADSPVEHFTIKHPSCPEEEVKALVREGVYRSAILLYYLYTCATPQGSKGYFLMTDELREITRAYFGEVISNKSVKSKTPSRLNVEQRIARALLRDSAFVYLSFIPHVG